jgi:hypothetical protein
MRDNSRTKADAARFAAIAGASEHVGSPVGDQEPNPLLDERNRCSVCEHGHHGHVCRWCIAEGRAAS